MNWIELNRKHFPGYTSWLELSSIESSDILWHLRIEMNSIVTYFIPSINWVKIQSSHLLSHLWIEFNWIVRHSMTSMNSVELNWNIVLEVRAMNSVELRFPFHELNWIDCLFALSSPALHKQPQYQKKERKYFVYPLQYQQKTL